MVQEVHMNVGTLFHNLSVKLGKGWFIQFIKAEWLVQKTQTKWMGKYVRHVPSNRVFKVLFTHTEGGHTWLHETTAEGSHGIIAGFDARYCKVISELEYGIEVGL